MKKGDVFVLIALLPLVLAPVSLSRIVTLSERINLPGRMALTFCLAFFTSAGHHGCRAHLPQGPYCPGLLASSSHPVADRRHPRQERVAALG